MARKRRKKVDPLFRSIEIALEPGTYISRQELDEFIEDLERTEKKLAALVRAGEAERAAALYEVFIAGCTEKNKEVHDNWWGFGDFIERLYCGWIRARQAAGVDPSKVAGQVLDWILADRWRLCTHLEKSALEAFDKAGRAAFVAAARRRFEENLGRQSASKRRKVETEGDAACRRLLELLKRVYLARRNVGAYAELCERTGLSPKDCAAIAQILASRRGKAEEALAWVERGLALEASGHRDSCYDLGELKRKLLVKLGRKGDALESIWAEFRKHPSKYTYEDLMRHVPRKDRKVWHAKALAVAEDASLEDFVDICVKKREWDRLASHLGEVDATQLEGMSHYTSEPAARGLAKRYPGVGASLYAAMALRVIKQGKSKYYEAAFDNLRLAKKCYEKAGRDEVWKALVAVIRRDHKRKYRIMHGLEDIVERKRRPPEPSFLEKAMDNWRQRGER